MNLKYLSHLMKAIGALRASRIALGFAVVSGLASLSFATSNDKHFNFDSPRNELQSWVQSAKSAKSYSEFVTKSMEPNLSYEDQIFLKSYFKSHPKMSTPSVSIKENKVTFVSGQSKVTFEVLDWRKGLVEINGKKITLNEWPKKNAKLSEVFSSLDSVFENLPSISFQNLPTWPISVAFAGNDYAVFKPITANAISNAIEINSRIKAFVDGSFDSTEINLDTAKVDLTLNCGQEESSIGNFKEALDACLTPSNYNDRDLVNGSIRRLSVRLEGSSGVSVRDVYFLESPKLDERGTRTWGRVFNFVQAGPSEPSLAKRCSTNEERQEINYGQITSTNNKLKPGSTNGYAFSGNAKESLDSAWALRNALDDCCEKGLQASKSCLENLKKQSASFQKQGRKFGVSAPPGQPGRR